MAGRLVVNTLNTDTVGAVLTTQNGMTGIAKAWVNFNGTGTVAIRDSFNVSSITDNGTGDYTVNFTTVMPNANYSWSFASQFSNTGSVTFQNIFPLMLDGANQVTTSGLRFNTAITGGTKYDCAIVAVTIFR